MKGITVNFVGRRWVLGSINIREESLIEIILVTVLNN